MLAEIEGGLDDKKGRAVSHAKGRSEGRRPSTGSVERGPEGSLQGAGGAARILSPCEERGHCVTGLHSA